MAPSFLRIASKQNKTLEVHPVKVEAFDVAVSTITHRVTNSQQQ